MNVWERSSELLARHLASGAQLDGLLDEPSREMSPVDRRRCRHLVYGAVRHRGLLEHAIAAHVRRSPRPGLRAVLMIGGFELLENPDATPAIVHHAVERARALTSPAEARLVNAVLRRMAQTLREARLQTPTDATSLALRYSHPAWLVTRWLRRWSPETVQRLLEWNQQPAPTHARLTAQGVAANVALPDFFAPTKWPGFFCLDQPDWGHVEELLTAGAIYIQDPATTIAPRLVAAQPGEVVLDLCAAPGGKTVQLAESVAPHGRVVAIDVPGTRLQRLRENLSRQRELPVTILGLDATGLSGRRLGEEGLPVAFDAALADVPCSNTGVLRHRVDAKWRLKPADLAQLPQLQFEILSRAAALVRPGGRMVYSTCSLEPEENEHVVDAFVQQERGEFSLERASFSLPWETGCDGAAAFLLRRAAQRNAG